MPEEAATLNRLKEYEVPIAYSMLMLAEQVIQHQQRPFVEYMCYWIAFNNIYTTLTDKVKGRVQLKKKDGHLLMRTMAGVEIPKVQPRRERDQLATALGYFGADLKDRLITHESMRFFVYRHPVWNGQEIKMDARGQRLNGVLNVGHTVSREDPVWSPIDIEGYERYGSGEHDEELRNELAEQILDVLYTVRNNTFHGGKRADDANDRGVVEKAMPLLRTIVKNFLFDAAHS